MEGLERVSYFKDMQIVNKKLLDIVNSTWKIDNICY